MKVGRERCLQKVQNQAHNHGKHKIRGRKTKNPAGTYERFFPEDLSLGNVSLFEWDCQGNGSPVTFFRLNIYASFHVVHSLSDGEQAEASSLTHFICQAAGFKSKTVVSPNDFAIIRIRMNRN